jgi:hypothetical protein
MNGLLLLELARASERDQVREANPPARNQAQHDYAGLSGRHRLASAWADLWSPQVCGTPTPYLHQREQFERS